MWLYFWLLEQSVILSLLVLCLFSSMRHQAALHRIEARVAFMQGLMIILATSWGDAPESVRRLLEAYVKGGGHSASAGG